MPPHTGDTQFGPFREDPRTASRARVCPIPSELRNRAPQIPFHRPAIPPATGESFFALHRLNSADCECHHIFMDSDTHLCRVGARRCVHATRKHTVCFNQLTGAPGRPQLAVHETQSWTALMRPRTSCAEPCARLERNLGFAAPEP